jgi:PAS domain S-box-containing protein
MKDKLSDVLDYLTEGFQVIDFDWRYRYANNTAVKQAKFSSKEDLLGYTVQEKYPDMIESEAFQIMQECMTERISKNFEIKFTFPDNSTGWFELRIEPVPEGIIQFVNNRFCNMVDYSSEELIGKKASEILLGEEERRRMKEIMESRRTGIESNYEMGLLKKSGEKVWTKINGIPIKNDQGNIIGSMGVHSDISRMKDTEKNLYESVERFNYATQASNEIIYDWKINDDAVWWNDRYYALMGKRKNVEWLTLESWTDFIHPDEKERILKSLEEFLHGSENYWSGEYKFVDSNGQVYYFSDRGYVLRDKDGLPYRMIGAITDITHLKQNINHLEKIIFSISHKVRQPLAHIVGIANLIQNSGNSEEDLDKMAQLMKHSASNLIHFTEELTELIGNIKSKNESKSVANFPEPIKMGE